MKDTRASVATKAAPYPALLEELKTKTERLKKGGGEAKIAAQHAKGKLTARERVAYLLDKNSSFVEVGLFAGEEMYEEYGGCPSGGVIVGVGEVSGRTCVVVAGDATVKAGAWFPITAKKNLRAQEIAMQNRLPVIYLVDSAGVFLPMQDEIFPDKEHFGRQFRNNARMSAMGIVQVAAVMGACVAGGAYLPAMSDEALIVDKTGSIFLAGSHLVKAAIGEEVENETLGGATTHCEISGLIDNKYKDDKACLDAIKRIFSTLASPARAGFDRTQPKPPRIDPKTLYTLFPVDRTKPYEMRKVLDCLLDDSQFDAYKQEYGKTLLCGYARIEGWAVGVVANERIMVKTHDGEFQMGGVIYSDAANKAARFIMNCNQRKIPLLFLHDVSGFMVGTRAEHGGIIKDGAKMVNAMANAVVPKFSVILGNSYGAGNYAMCGRAYDPRMVYAWPSARMGVMSGEAAAQTLLQIKLSSLKKKATKESLSEKQKQQLLDEITQHYNHTLSPYYAAARLWIDDIIDPLATRNKVAAGIAMADHAPLTRSFRTGVLQT